MTLRLTQFTAFLFLILLLIAPSPATHAQEVAPCPLGFGCVEVTLSPDSLIGDFFVGETLFAAAQHSALLQLPPAQAQQITIRNIQDSAPGFGQLFVYAETRLSVSVREAQFRQFSARPRQTFIRGILNFTCAVSHAREGESVACLVLVDGAVLGEVPLNASADFILDPGERALQAQLIGSHVGLWSSTVYDQTVYITVGRTSRARPQFTKLGHLLISLNQPNVVGDFYLNGELIAAQAPSVDRWVAPHQRYTIEVKNLTDPAAAGIYRWRDTSTSTYVSPGQEAVVQVRLRKENLPETTWEATVVALINQQRTAVGLNALAINPILTATAEEYALYMAQNNFFDHTGLDGTLPWDRARANGYGSDFVGENIAYASWLLSAEEAFRLWWESPPHHDNMLFPDYTEIGIAWAGPNGNGEYYYVMNLGRR